LNDICTYYYIEGGVTVKECSVNPKKIGPNLWQIKISVRVPGRGEPVKKQEQFHGTKTEADSRESELVNFIKDSSGSASVSHTRVETFKNVLALHVEKLKSKDEISPSHQKKITFVEKELGNWPVVGFADRFEHYIKLLKSTKTMHKTTRSAASTNRIISLVRAAFNTAIDLELIDKNPITKARFPQGEEQARDRYLTHEERVKLLAAIRECRPFVQYSLLVPSRKSELTTATRDRYNKFTETIYIATSKSGIPINKPVPREMREYFRNIPVDCPYLFYRQDSAGRYHPLGDFRKAWATCLEKAELKDVHVHDLRHISATDLYAAGIPEREIMDIAGWKTPMLTTYRNKNSLKTAQKLNTYFDQTDTTPFKSASK
jgi:integrase